MSVASSPGWVGWLTDLARTATGQEHRDDPALPTSGGPAGNARLTAWAGLVLLALFVVECATLLALRQTLGVHIVVGTALIPLVVVKTASTAWRMVRYYAGGAAYRQGGPPPLLLRLLGPLVVLTAFAVVGSGLALIPLGAATYRPLLTVAGQQIDALTVHKLCFVAWFGVVGVHTLARLVPATQLVAGRAELSGVAGGRARVALLVVALVVGALAGVAVLHGSSAWTDGSIVNHSVGEDAAGR